MRLAEGALLVTAGDVVESTTCSHRTISAYRRAHGLPVEGAPEPGVDPGSAVVRAGVEHEQLVVEAMRAQGLTLVDLTGTTPDLGAWSLLAATTAELLRTSGADVVLQGGVLDACPDGMTFVGRPDFLVRVGQAWRVEDAKLARSLSPSALLQTMLYRDALAAAGITVHDDVRLHLGSGEVLDVPARTGAAWARRQVADLADLLAALPARGALEAGFSAPAQWCSVCEDASPCGVARARADHLGAVADLRRDQARRLAAAGIDTVAALATAHGPVPGMPAATFEALHEQAALQVQARESGSIPVKVREHPRTLGARDVRPGLWLVPAPSEGDVFFDMEGDPLWTTPGGRGALGLEYLFGATHDGAEFTPFWAHDRAQERRAFEDFVDWVQERRVRWPDLRVYHYAAYEKTALSRLAAQHDTRADVVDGWLREGVMVDLYQAVRRGIRAGVTSYSIKKIEKLYGVDHSGLAVATAMASVEQYEAWRTTQDQEVLEEIETYNRLDCDSTRELRGYLLRLREAAVEAGTLVQPVVEGEPPPEEPGELSDKAQEKAALLADLAAMTATLLGGADTGEPSDDPVAEARRVLAGLLGYHVREEKAAWQDVFRVAERAAADGPPAAVADPAVLGGLELDHATTTAKGVPVWTFTAPAQEHKVDAGQVLACVAGAPVSARITALEPGEGDLSVTVTVSAEAAERGGWTAAAPPDVDALIPSATVPAEALQRSLLALAEVVGPSGAARDGGLGALADPLTDPRGPRTAGRALLLGRASLSLPALPAAEPDEDAVAHAVRLARGDSPAGDGLVIAVQGPPGAGKSYLGSKVVDALVADARTAGTPLRIGVTANSHAVVQHLLKAIHRRTPGAVVRHKGPKKSGKNPETWDRLCEHEACDNPLLSTANLDGWASAEVIGGTAWAFSPPTSPDLDVLVVDEAGQMGLGDVLAASRNARTVLLLGDPQQLAKPSRAAHPPGVAVSALEHLMGTHATMPPTRGIFLPQTWRMHEDVSGFISDIAYDGRLTSADVTVGRAVLPLVTDDTFYAGTGLRWVPVAHEGNAQGSEEECAAVVDLVRELLTRTWTDEGEEKPIAPADVLVVSPYNVQVRRLRAALDDAGLGDVPAGTVDKFQGQEGVAVIYSTASSDAEEAPRGLGFLYDTHRLNVAISRARCLAFWVGSPELLRPRVTGAEQVPLVDAHCAFVERAVAVAVAVKT